LRARFHNWLMKKSIFLLLGLLFLAGCGSSEPRDESRTMGQFYVALGEWMDGSGGERACQFLPESELQGADAFAKSATGGDLCEGALRKNFAFLNEPDKINKIAPAGKAEKVTRQGETIWVQPVSLKMTIDGKQQEVLARSAAVVRDGKIQSLNGMRISTVAPEQFAENIDSPTVIRVDPVLAAYFSSRG
jgi:hypothetical protein